MGRSRLLITFAFLEVFRLVFNDALNFMGQDRSWEHHFLLHVAAKRSEEYEAWWSAVEKEGGGFKPGGLRETFRRRADKR